MARTWMWALTLLWTAAAVNPAWAVKSEEWKHEQPKDFVAATLDNVVVSSQGEVILGRQVKTLPKPNDEDQVVNALARAGDGRVYAATGPEGRIYQIDGDAVKEFAKLPDGGTVLSLLFDANGHLLAGTGGGAQARIYLIDGTGKATVFYEPKGARYIWAMVRGSGGEIYAATGIEGKLYSIDADGKNGKVLAKVKPKNLLSLAIGANNMLYGGTDEDGLVYRFGAGDGKAYVLYDAKEAEISSIAVDDDGNVFAATASAESARPGRTVADKPGGTPDHSDARASSASKPSAAEPGRPEAAPSGKKTASQPTSRRTAGATIGKVTTEGGGNAIYRIDTNGFVTEVFREPVVILAMVENQGVLYAATGNEGRVYSVSPNDERTTMLAKLEAAQATSLIRLPDGQLLIGTANSPGFVRMTEGRASRGTLVSKSLDASQIVKWGRVRWDASIPEGTKLTVATRSSNVEDIESDAWEEWSSEMDASTAQQIASASARFLQYRLTLTTSAPDKTPALRSLNIPYVDENHPPEVSSIEVVAAREEAQKPTASPAVKAAVGMAGFGGAAPSGPNDYWVIKWKAEDPNKDSLKYEVFYRQVGTNRWIQFKDKNLTEPLKIWDTRTVDDGKYEVRVVAKDTPSNPPATDLSAARVSEPMIVDNTPPEIQIEKAEVKGKSVTVHALLTDTGTPIVEAGYIVDSDEEWGILAADDDIFDSKSESVTFTVPDLEPGEHRITIRTKDAWGNMRYVSRTINSGG